MSRIVVVGVLLASLLYPGSAPEHVGAWAAASTASPQAGSDPAGCAARRLSRVSDASRTTTATTVARYAWSSADELVLASADDYPDALTATVLAAERDAPILITPRDRLVPEVAHEIQRLDPSKVWIVGGHAALSEAVQQQVEATAGRPRTVRIAGSDRYATAAATARETGTRGVVALVSGERFPDAVAAGALAAAPWRVPTLLTPADRLHDATRDALRDLGAKTVYVIGGHATVRSSVDDELRDAGYTVERLAGADRYSTSASVAHRAVEAFEGRQRGVVFATGSTFPDALTAAGLAARTDAVLALVPPADARLPQEMASLVDGSRDRLDCNVVVGGTAAVSPSTADRIAWHLGVHPPDTPNLADSPCDTVIEARTDGVDQTPTIQAQIDAAPDGTAEDPTVVCLPVGRADARYRVDGTLEVTGRSWLEIRGPSPEDQATIYSDLDGITAGHVGHTGQSARRHWRLTDSSNITLRNLRVEGPFHPGNPHYDGITRRHNNFGDPGYAYFDRRFEAEHAFDLRGSHHISIFDTSSKDVGGDHLHAMGVYGNSDDGSTDIRLVRAHADHPHRHGAAPIHVRGLLIDALTVLKGGYDYIDFEPGGDVQQVHGVEIRNGDADVHLLAFGAEGAGLVSNVYIHHNRIRSATPSWAVVHVDGGDPARYGRRSSWSVVDNLADGFPVGTCSTRGTSSAFTFVDVDDVEVRRNRVRVKAHWSCNALAHFFDVGGHAWLTENVAVDACTAYRWFADGVDRTGTSSDYFADNLHRRSGNETTGTGCRD